MTVTQKPTRMRYEAPKLEVHRLRDLPPALATSGHRGCHVTNSKHSMSCSVDGDAGKH